GKVDLFKISAYRGGVLLTFPTRENPRELEPFKEEVSLFEQLMLSNSWGELMEVSNVSDLNDKICEGHIKDLILIQEALMERRIGEIAQKIYDKKENVKIVLIAGPSSSGKTTFANRLAIQLKSFGLKPHIIGMDDYFVNREKTPVDQDGNYNFDVIEAVDIEQFEEDMNSLLDGETVEMPTFDFKSGKRVYKGNTMKLGEDDILVIEGIHALNPKSSNTLPKEKLYKLYISAMNSLNIDDHNRIPSTDVRMIRRMIRDARTRGSDAKATIGGWKKVRDGEDINIFPYQDEADSVFNSTICYELAVLKQFAEPLLYNVQRGDPEFYEAKRMLKFFDYILGIDTAEVPMNSICREFIGGGFLG
ncbi:MAG: nucleoside kinase, partial [Erysipelotrichales bacterium]|nr:nucleoside kinase [Erysipelotrichales bacterium]